MANVDLQTKKIHGAVPGTKKYYHEVGHLNFEEDVPFGNFTRVIQDFSFKALVFLVAFYIMLPCNLFLGLIVLDIMINIVSELYEEQWCWGYANYKLKEKIKKRDDTKEEE